MIEQTKKSEADYLKSLNEKLLDTSSFGETKSQDDFLKELEETFRNPNNLFQSLEEMQRKQEASLNAIQLKLNEMKQVKIDLKTSYQFIPNSSLLNKQDASSSSLFGSLKWNQYSLKKTPSSSNQNLFQSQIVKNHQQRQKLIHLCEFSPNDKFALLYRGSQDGLDANDFHSKCDGHKNTLTIIKAKSSSYVFGAFTAVEWESLPPPGKFKSDPRAFLFSLTNKKNKPLKMKIEPNRCENAIFCNSELGPSFGDDDIWIENNPNKTMGGISYLGFAYKHPQYACGSEQAKSFLAGRCAFELEEIEVYQKLE
jgi:hypothetical protein